MGQALIRVSHNNKRFRLATFKDVCQSKNNLIILSPFKKNVLLKVISQIKENKTSDTFRR